MKVLELWREMHHDELYCSVFSDRELLELSERLFGTLPGTREFVSACMAKSEARPAMRSVELGTGA
jgi:hypothetical protein